jgi:hypothetical protein
MIRRELIATFGAGVAASLTGVAPSPSQAPAGAAARFIVGFRIDE